MLLSPISILSLPILLVIVSSEQELNLPKNELLLKFIQILQDKSKQDNLKYIQNATSEEENNEKIVEKDSMEYGQFYEGDMIIENSKSRSKILQTNYWANGVIPFDFDRGFPYEDRQRVLEIINYLNQHTCLHLRKTWHFLDKGTYVKITNAKQGCFATVGRPSSGKGKVNLSHSCMSKDGVIIHELLHSAGIFHEHSRYDRDNYVKIHWENIQPGENAFGQPNEKVGEKVQNWNSSSEENPEELGEYAEGDILFPIKTRNGLIAETARWKDGIVPYEISGYFPPNGLQTIQRAMDIYHKYTCIRFRKRTASDEDYLSIKNSNSGCWSSVGRLTGRQEVNLQSPSCTTKVGTSMHELMHALGFLHEQNRPERDDFVSIAWQNIKSGHDGNFQKAKKGTTDGYGIDYDYRSVMHYSEKAFSVNGRSTIIPKVAEAKGKMGQRDGFSRGDIIKINTMYKCDPASISKPIPTTQTTDSNNNNNTGGEGGGGILGFLFQLFTD